MTILSKLNKAIDLNDANLVQDAIYELGELRDERGLIPDEVSFAVIDVLQSDEMKSSPLAGHILNFFEFDIKYISEKAKNRCAEFLRTCGDDFTHVHSSQVAVELDDMLKMGNSLPSWIE